MTTTAHLKFTSGNGVPVERATLTRDEFADAIRATQAEVMDTVSDALESIGQDQVAADITALAVKLRREITTDAASAIRVAQAEALEAEARMLEPIVGYDPVHFRAGAEHAATCLRHTAATLRRGETPDHWGHNK